MSESCLGIYLWDFLMRGWVLIHYIRGLLYITGNLWLNLCLNSIVSINTYFTHKQIQCKKRVCCTAQVEDAPLPLIPSQYSIKSDRPLVTPSGCLGINNGKKWSVFVPLGCTVPWIHVCNRMASFSSLNPPATFQPSDPFPWVFFWLVLRQTQTSKAGNSWLAGGFNKLMGENVHKLLVSLGKCGTAVLLL